MADLDSVFQAEIDWLSVVNPHDALEIRSVLQNEPDPIRAASIWVNSKFGVAGRHTSEVSPQAKGFMDHVQDEVHELLSSPDKYQSERQELIKKGEDSRTAALTYIAASIQPYFGGGSTMIFPVVAVILTVIGRIGRKAWCAQQDERRKR